MLYRSKELVSEVHPLSIHPSVTALSLSGVFRGAGASPVCLGARGALCPGQVVSLSQGENIETDNHSDSLVQKVNSESSTHPQMHVFERGGSQKNEREPAWTREEHAHRKAPGTGRCEQRTFLPPCLKCSIKAKKQDYIITRSRGVSGSFLFWK